MHSDYPQYVITCFFLNVTIINKRTNEEISCSICVLEVNHNFYQFKVFCIVLDIGIKN